MGDSKHLDLRDAETGPLLEKDESQSTVSQHGRALWSTRTMMLLFIIGALAVTITILHVDNSPSRNYLKRSDSRLNLIVVGDWGREGQHNQSIIAEQMGRVGKELNLDFVISTGDNFYDTGLSDVDDALFDASFTQIYKEPSLQTMWYTVLGNHDYRGDPEVQVDDRLKIRDPRWFCEYTYTLPVEIVKTCNGQADRAEFFFIDTNPFEEDYWYDNYKYNWTRLTPREVVIANQLKVLNASLEASTAKWKIVVGHHTIFSYGHHGNTQELVDKVVPIMEANKVDLYLNGHDHDLQHIKRTDSDIHFVTSGGGSKAWQGVSPPNTPDSRFFFDGEGFVSISITPTVLQINFYDITGSNIYQTELKN